MKGIAKPIRLAAGLLALLVLLGSQTVVAQQSRSLRIADGEVYIDGRQVAREDLPAGLRLEGMTVNYTFTGDVRPVVQIGDAFYVIEGDRLRQAEPTEHSLFPQGPAHLREFVPPDVHVEFRSPAAPRRSELDAPADPAASPRAAEFDRKAEVFNEQARRLEQLQQDLQSQFRAQQVQFETRQLQEVERLVQEMSRHAVEAAQMASDLPRLELESYLEDVRRQNEGLFDRLVSEQQLERETLEMARQIRSVAREDRRERIEALRSKLDEIFDLKQENRRNEIQQLERRLEDLEQRLAERERLRAEMVERRIRELLGESE